MKAPLALLVGIGAWHASTGQVLNASAVTMVVSTGAQVVVQGGVRLDLAAVVENDGAVRVLGDWTNNSGGSGFTAGSTGNVYLYNTLPQLVQGTAITDFRSLVVSGGDKTLLQDAQCGTAAQPDGTLSLTSGVLALNGRRFALYNAASSALATSGGSIRSESTDLQSRFQWSLGSDVTEHVIPFSTVGGTSVPFGFALSAAFPANTIITVATYPTAPNNTPFPVTSNQQVLNMAGATLPDNSANTVDRFWLADLPDGSFTGTLRLSYAPPEDPAFGPGPVRAQRWLESGSTWQYPPPPGQSNPAARQVLVPNIVLSNTLVPANEHIWAMAYDHSPLPITLLRFEAWCGLEGMHVEWSTASEQQSASFTVERSADGIAWTSVGTLYAAGNSVVPINYGLLDTSLVIGGQVYYRLWQYDHDGTGRMVSVTSAIPCAGGSFTLYPSPARTEVFALLPSSMKGTDLAAMIQVHDAFGRSVLEGAIVLTGGLIQLDVNNWAVGSYHITIHATDGSVLGQGRFVKE